MNNSLHLDLVRVTEAAAISASSEVGRGDKIAVDEAATTAMRERLNKIDFCGHVVIGEGVKDAAPMLYINEKLGLKSEDEPQYDIAVDPVDGTTAAAFGKPEAMSVIALGERGSLFSSEVFYMQKLAVGPQVCSKVELDLTDGISRTIKLISLALSKEPSKMTVCMLDRPRHEETIGYLRRLGCRIKLIQDCDVSAAIATALPDSGIDVYMGIGGAPEGVIAAAALRCLGGLFQGMLVDPKGNPVDNKVYQANDLAKGDVMFCATGITTGSLLKGVTYSAYGKAKTHSLLMRSESGTVRFMESFHGN